MPRKVLIAVLLALWSFRLARYILRDRIGRGQEDGRYQALRAHWGDRAHRNFFWFFEAQAVLVILFSIPCLAAMMNDRPGFGAWSFAGVAVWAISVLGETLADRQLARFRADPAQSGQGLRPRPVALFAAPQLFFRVASLVEPCPDRDRRPVRVADFVGTDFDVSVPF